METQKKIKRNSILNMDFVHICQRPHSFIPNALFNENCIMRIYASLTP